MQRIKTTRWPVRNPFGDNLYYKLRIVAGAVNSMPTTGSSLVVFTAQANNAAAYVNSFGPGPGLTQLSAAFQKYRVMGVKVKLTAWPDAASPQPICLFTNASADATFPAPTVSILPEQRWGRYRVIASAATGARPTSLTSYYSINKIYGPDQVVKNDVEFTANTATSTPYFGTAPSAGPNIQWGFFTLSGVNPTAAINCTIKTEITLYLKYFFKAELNPV